MTALTSPPRHALAGIALLVAVVACLAVRERSVITQPTES